MPATTRPAPSGGRALAHQHRSRNLHYEGGTYKIPSKPLDFRFHIIHLVGRLTKTPRYTITGNDKSRTNFTLAIDGLNGTTDYCPVVSFGPVAQSVAEYTDKGHLVSVEGRVSSGKYTNEAGETVYTLDLIAHRVHFLSKPKASTTTPETIDPEGEVA